MTEAGEVQDPIDPRVEEQISAGVVEVTALLEAAMEHVRLRQWVEASDAFQAAGERAQRLRWHLS